jgi:hypothetical protein
VTGPYPRSLLALAVVALAAAALFSALAARRSAGSGGPRPASAPAPGGGWYQSMVAVSSARGASACGGPLGGRMVGILDPVLPCGTRLVLLYEGREIAARVVDRTAPLAGRDFSVTPPLARALGLTGVRRLGWRFARPTTAPGE